MKTVILAGGKGLRMRPLTNKMPKPMLPINGRPILEHQIMLLKKSGVKDIIICGCYLFDKIKSYFRDGKKFGVRIKYIKEKKPLGTGGAIKNAEKYIDGAFLVLCGDVMMNINIKRFIHFHKERKGIATLLLHHSDHPEDSSVVEIDKNNKVIKLWPKGQGPTGLDLTKSSLYVLEKRVLQFMPKKRHCLEDDILPELIGKENVFGFVTNEFVKDIGTIERYEKVKKMFE